jgi:hypothetical protein
MNCSSPTQTKAAMIRECDDGCEMFTVPTRLHFVVVSDGDKSAGMNAFTDDVFVKVSSGDPGGDPGEFTEYVRQCLSNWYDGAAITLK